jgi:Dihaem cytochrome c
MKNILRMLIAGLCFSAMALADENGGDEGGEQRGKPLQPTKLNAKWQQECGSCHMAFAPGLLPVASWRKLMSGLDKHFDTDASLTEQENTEITDFLVKNASNRWKSPTAPLRITETRWFKRKHDAHEVPPAVWKRPSVKSPANCQACHTGADKGDFGEEGIKIPQ